jgi:UDP-glucose 4-epimerase/UDP-glucuronate decarboxylase
LPARNLVTGAAGVSGFELTRALLERGEEVLAVDDLRKGGGDDLVALAEEYGGKLELSRLDLASEGAARELSGESYATFFHLAAIVGVGIVEADPYAAVAQNLRATLAAFDAVRSGGAEALVFASSSECYASGVDAGQVSLPTPEDVPLGISDPRLPRWSYAASKIAGESALFAAARAGDFAPLVLRFHNVYGPRMGLTHVIPELLDRCRRGLDPFPLRGAEQTRSFLYATDAARAVLLGADHVRDQAPGEGHAILHVGSGEETSIEELARLIFEVSGHHPRVERLPAPRGSVQRRVPDVSRLRDLGFVVRVSLVEGLISCWRRTRD